MAQDNPFKLASEDEIADRKRDELFRYGKHKNIVCVTDKRGSPREDQSELIEAVRRVAPDPRVEIVVDATKGYIPLWDQSVTLRWTFNEVSMKAFSNPAGAKTAIEALLDEALSRWGDACPVKFVRDDQRYDFEFAMRSRKRCSAVGCVLASTFFPDGGQHEFVMYPTLFDEQTYVEQVETFIHELGHVFGLRHFFALIRETAMPAIIFGKHKKFSIMNYGKESRLTEDDKADLKRLYDGVWSRKITALNGTRFKLMQPSSAKVP
jgi:hypothetical protein